MGERAGRQCGLLARGLADGFGRVLPERALRAGVARLADLVTLDVVSVMAAFHLRLAEAGGAPPDAFEDGSEEQMLLKLHRRTAELRRTLEEVAAAHPHSPCLGCSVLAARRRTLEEASGPHSTSFSISRCSILASGYRLPTAKC